MRCEVAVGTDRLTAIFSAILAETPRSGTTSSAGPIDTAGAVSFATEVDAGLEDAPFFASVTAAGPCPFPSNTDFQLSSTYFRSWRYVWYSSSSSQLLIPSLGSLWSDMLSVR